MILLFSGGLDSLCLWFLQKKPSCLYVRLGHRYQVVEERKVWMLKGIPELDLKVVKADRLDLSDREQSDGYIPLRNLYLVMIASEYSNDIVLGALKGERSTDKDDRFNYLTNDLLSHCLERRVCVHRPAANWTKAELVRRYLKAGGPSELLKKTVSCYNGGFCGKCQSCFRRWVAMTLNGIEEQYENDPRLIAYDWRKGVKKYGLMSVLKTLPSNWDAYRALRKAGQDVSREAIS